ncbi:MAG TPA: trypsin-like peptidase domain-containing protein [Gemmataceae bacterium]|nr:trypsin-like peptidase domain-containing protein [Gemmataceae bacterium]
MTEILVTCTDCGTTLKVAGESPDGRFVRCPSCTTIFVGVRLERLPRAGCSGPKLTCSDCGAIQYAVQPVAGGKFVRCVECGSVFRVPALVVGALSSTPAVTAPANTCPSATQPKAKPAPPSPVPVQPSFPPPSPRPRPAAPERRLGRSEVQLEEFAIQELTPRERRKLIIWKRDNSSNWVPLAFIGGFGLAVILAAVVLVLTLRPAGDNGKLAVNEAQHGVAAETRTADERSQLARATPPPASPDASFTVPSQPPASGSGPGGQTASPRQGPAAGDQDRQPQPTLPPAMGRGRPGVVTPPAAGSPVPGNGGPGGFQGGSRPPQQPGQNPGPYAGSPGGQNFWPPRMLPGGIGSRRFQRPNQPADAEPFTPDGNIPIQFERWLQDLEAAKELAARDRKDILLLFSGSDWCGASVHLSSEVLLQPQFDQDMRRLFVPVFVDFPKRAEAKSKVQDAARNERLARKFKITGYPTVILTDAQGRPYGVDGYRQGGVEAYWQRIMKARVQLRQRDELFARVNGTEGLRKLQAAQFALKLLEDNDLVIYYGDLLAEWSAAAEEIDPRNAAGHAEVFFEASWVVRVISSDPKEAQELKQLLGDFDHWKRRNRFKDANRAAQLHLLAAVVCFKLNDEENALDYVRQASEYQPTDPDLLALLKKLRGGGGGGSGTGFVVASGGYIMTNNHVVGAAGKIFVRVPGVKEPVPAQRIAADREHDMALIRVKLPEGVRLKPLALAADHPVSRGQAVAALGFPLGEVFGTGLKLTTGVVSALPDASSRNMFVLDARINPGNSGGPVCDAAGNVLGMVTLKLAVHLEGVDAYGAAIPAQDLVRFLKKNLKDYKPLTPGQEKKQWDDVDRKVSPSVLMILSKG